VKILVINSGSSSLKFKLFVLPDLIVSASGLVERIGDDNSVAHLSQVDSSGIENTKELERSEAVPDHRQAIRLMIEMLRESGAL